MNYFLLSNPNSSIIERGYSENLKTNYQDLCDFIRIDNNHLDNNNLLSLEGILRQPKFIHY